MSRTAIQRGYVYPWLRAYRCTSCNARAGIKNNRVVVFHDLTCARLSRMINKYPQYR